MKRQLLAGADRLVEASTLGEYGIDEHGAVMELEREAAATSRLAGPAGRTRGARCERVPAAADCVSSGRGAPARP